MWHARAKTLKTYPPPPLMNNVVQSEIPIATQDFVFLGRQQNGAGACRLRPLMDTPLLVK